MNSETPQPAPVRRGVEPPRVAHVVARHRFHREGRQTGGRTFVGHPKVLLAPITAARFGFAHVVEIVPTVTRCAGILLRHVWSRGPWRLRSVDGSVRRRNLVRVTRPDGPSACRIACAALRPVARLAGGVSGARVVASVATRENHVALTVDDGPDPQRLHSCCVSCAATVPGRRSSLSGSGRSAIRTSCGASSPTATKWRTTSCARNRPEVGDPRSAGCLTAVRCWPYRRQAWCLAVEVLPAVHRTYIRVTCAFSRLMAAAAEHITGPEPVRLSSA